MSRYWLPFYPTLLNTFGLDSLLLRFISERNFPFPALHEAVSLVSAKISYAQIHMHARDEHAGRCGGTHTFEYAIAHACWRIHWYTDTNTRTRTYARHARTYTQTHEHVDMFIHTRAYVHLCMHAHTRTNAYSCASTLTRTHANICKYLYAHELTCTCTDACENVHVHTRERSHTRNLRALACTHRSVYAYTVSFTHNGTHICTLWLMYIHTRMHSYAPAHKYVK